MKQFRLVRFGRTSDALVSNLSYNMGSVQTEFAFNSNNDQIEYPESLDISRPVSAATLEALLSDYMRGRYPGEYPIGLCDCPLEDGVLTSADKESTLITTYETGNRFAPTSEAKGIPFCLVDPLLVALGLTTPAHYDARGCPMDYWADNSSALRQGLSVCEFCPECRSLLVRALNRGQITPAQVAAVYAILDFVADRKLCFVLMPFAAEFQLVYADAIKPAMTRLGWDCRRADEIYEPREIINIICQEIHRSRLVIADLTGRNPNVFYELGYAHAAGKNTLLLAQSIADVPFDLRHRQLIEYAQTEDGLSSLGEALTMYV